MNDYDTAYDMAMAAEIDFADALHRTHDVFSEEQAAFEDRRRFESWCEGEEIDPDAPDSEQAYVDYLEGFFPED